MASPPSNFYLYLSSHGQTRHVSAQYSIPTPIDFTQCPVQYEVALIELVMKKNFFTIPSFTYTIMLEVDVASARGEEGPPTRIRRITRRAIFPEGLYNNIFEFCKMLNYKLAQEWLTNPSTNEKTKGSDVVEVYIPAKIEDVEKTTSKAQITLKLNARGGISLPPFVHELLGIPLNVTTLNRTSAQVKLNLTPTDFFKNLHTLMVLCPHVESCNVNGKTAPILRLFNIDNTDVHETVYMDWSSHPIYFTVRSDYIAKLLVVLVDAELKPLTGMTTGETLILLHFRQKR